MLAPALKMRGLVWLPILLFIAACGGGDTGPKGPAVSAVDIISGNNQTGFVGLTLTTPLIVKVTGSDGKAVAGVTVSFRVTSGSATVSPASAVTDVSGQARTQLTFGSTPGNVQITASVDGTNLTATFLEVAGTTSVTLACQSGSATLPAVLQVTAGLTGTGICLGGGTAGADYALIPFHTSTTPGATAAVAITGRGVTPLTSTSLAPSFDLQPSPASALTVPAAGDLQAAFDAKLRLSARRTLTPMIPAARAWAQRRGGALFDPIPATITVGQLLRLNANAADPCGSPRYRTGRVAAITSTAIVVADTGNPQPTFTDAQYQSIGVTFDTLINPMDTQAFGQPTDIDKNGHILIFFTRAVNELTPPGAPGGFVGGFFYERDLFPIASTPTLDACPSSNVGEMFYMLAPDQAGVVNGNKQDTARVRQLTIGTIAHEYQHLINAARRLYINDADDFEEVWLNEGLSHIAEELLFYRVSGFSPRQNLTSSRIRASQETVNAFNNYENPNFGRFEEFLKKASTTSPYADNDSLQTRGATWAMLRDLADHRGSSDGDTWLQLDNSKTTGIANMKNVFGTDVVTQIRDWATSVFTDDVVAATDTRFQQPSWNFRSVFTQAFNIPYPLQILPLADGVPTTVNLLGGGMAYLRFTVPAAGQGSVDWTASGGAPVSPLVQWTLVRTR